MRTALVLNVLIAVLAACGGESRAIDSTVSCSSDQQCSAPTPACDTQAMACVQCTDLNASACTGATPNCGADHACKAACAADTDCLSGACLGDGSCANPNRILWVTRDAPATGPTCTPMDRCQLVTALGLVSATKDIIHLDPLGYTFTTGVSLTQPVTIVGRGASIGVNQAPAFRVMNGTAATLDGFALTSSPAQGLECTNGKLTVRALTVAGSKGIGLIGSGCTLAVERSTFRDNLGGAMQLGGGGTFTITNTFVFRNGNATDANVGGIDILGSVGVESRLEFDTIVDNLATAGGTSAGGVACNTTFAAANNIVARNAVGGSTTAANAQTLGACTYPTSTVQNDIAGLAFTSPDTAPFSYKLGAGSTALDKATTASAVAIDNDGDARPQGAQKDQGADERLP